MFNHLTKPPAASGAALGVVAVLVFGAAADPQRASDAPPTQKKLTFRDIQLTVHARKALAGDPVLGPTNLGVRVQDNVAQLWGPVASEEVRRRAVEVVKRVKGVFEVRDGDVYIAASPPTLDVPSPPPEAPTRTESASPDPASGKIGDLIGRTAAPPAAVPPPILGSPFQGVEAAPARTSSAAPFVAWSPAVVAWSPDHATAGADLRAAVDLVRQADPRFRAIDCWVEGDVVVLRPGAAHGEDAMAFAQAISRLPGLSRIVVRTDDADAANKPRP
jgi:hypothetical protein